MGGATGAPQGSGCPACLGVRWGPRPFRAQGPSRKSPRYLGDLVGVWGAFGFWLVGWLVGGLSQSWGYTD
eukprot:8645244-Pyramimonas_sp.AAC.1